MAGTIYICQDEFMTTDKVETNGHGVVVEIDAKEPFKKVLAIIEDMHGESINYHHLIDKAARCYVLLNHL